MHKITAAFGKRHADIANQMWLSMWRAYLQKGDAGRINMCYWADQFNDDRVTNQIIMLLHGIGAIHVLAASVRNWAEAHIPEQFLLQFVTIDELNQVRQHRKFTHYCLKSEPETDICDLVKVNGVIKRTGLTAPGTMALANTSFSFDTEKMAEYQHIIVRNFTKSMDKMQELCPSMRSDQASYDTISAIALDYYINNPLQEYSRGTSYMDSRGRAISSSLSKIGNPIGFKDMRALIKLPTVPLDVKANCSTLQQEQSCN